MSLMAIIAAGQNGLLIRSVGGAIGVDEPVARAAIERLLPPMARQLSERAHEPEESEIVLDVVAYGGFQRYLDDPRALLGREAIRDGEDMLTYLYGSVEAAREQARAIGPPAGLDAEVFARLTTLAACLVLGAMARRLEHHDHEDLAELGVSGMLKGLGQAIVRGFIEGSTRSLGRRRAGFRRRMARRRARRDHSPSRRPSLDEILSDLLGGDFPRQ
jgi:hypothetical protein